MNLLSKLELHMYKNFILILVSLMVLWSCSPQEESSNNSVPPSSTKQQINKDGLTAEEERIIVHKGTEPPGSGEYNKFYEDGIYLCKRCELPLFRSESKFDSKSGWPAFDDNISDAVKEVPDGSRTEIVCAKCDGHLGHVFMNEGFTDKNTRHCVNSLSMKFLPENKYGKAIFASGCFWGTEYFLQKAEGVISTSCGYIGGHTKNPTYKAVCTGSTGHAEAVEVIYDKSKTNFETLCKLFFETHNPTQLNRQGPDIGTQYRSEIFFLNEEQKTVSNKLIDELKGNGLAVVTKVTKASEFYDAEDYHQDYYIKKNGIPYCHKLEKKFLR